MSFSFLTFSVRLLFDSMILRINLKCEAKLIYTCFMFNRRKKSTSSHDEDKSTMNLHSFSHVYLSVINSILLCLTSIEQKALRRCCSNKRPPSSLIEMKFMNLKRVKKVRKSQIDWLY